jgi:hypothetical protein
MRGATPTPGPRPCCRPVLRAGNGVARGGQGEGDCAQPATGDPSGADVADRATAPRSTPMSQHSSHADDRITATTWLSWPAPAPTPSGATSRSMASRRTPTPPGGSWSRRQLPCDRPEDLTAGGTPGESAEVLWVRETITALRLQGGRAHRPPRHSDALGAHTGEADPVTGAQRRSRAAPVFALCGSRGAAVDLPVDAPVQRQRGIHRDGFRAGRYSASRMLTGARALVPHLRPPGDLLPRTLAGHRPWPHQARHLGFHPQRCPVRHGDHLDELSAVRGVRLQAGVVAAVGDPDLAGVPAEAPERAPRVARAQLFAATGPASARTASAMRHIGCRRHRTRADLPSPPPTARAFAAVDGTKCARRLSCRASPRVERRR